MKYIMLFILTVSTGCAELPIIEKAVEEAIEVEEDVRLRNYKNDSTLVNGTYVDEVMIVDNVKLLYIDDHQLLIYSDFISS